MFDFLFSVGILGIIALFAILYRERYKRLVQHIDKFKGPTKIPILGNLLQLGFTPDGEFLV